MAKDNDEAYDEFYDVVNMTPSEIEDWLNTDKSKSVGADAGDGDSKGRKSAKKIVDIKKKKKDNLTEDDYDHMRKVIGYVNRHRAQQPDSDIKESDWRYSLKNWGHDPCKELDCS
ncbi:MAG: DUF3140 domain-containing protein [Leeuwenhoekiella sp.]